MGGNKSNAGRTQALDVTGIRNDNTKVLIYSARVLDEDRLMAQIDLMGCHLPWHTDGFMVTYSEFKLRQTMGRTFLLLDDEEIQLYETLFGLEGLEGLASARCHLTIQRGRLYALGKVIQAAANTIALQSKMALPAKRRGRIKPYKPPTDEGEEEDSEETPIEGTVQSRTDR